MKDAKGMHEGRKRSMLKAISWRIIATSIGMLLIYLFTEKLELTVVSGIGDGFLKFVFYFIHERLWDKITFGRTSRDTA